MEALQFSKFHKSEAEQEKFNFKKGSTWHLKSEVRKIINNIFTSLLFLWVNNQNVKNSRKY